MSLSPTSDNAADYSAFVCDCEEWVRSACEGEDFYREHEGKRYCVLHYPGKDKSSDFAVALKRKLDAQDYNFCGVWFPDPLNFSRFEFSAVANFFSATFSAEAYFSSTTFSAEASFLFATFSAGAYFSSATFKAVTYFSSATFSAEADFYSATFSAGASFLFATFSTVANFDSATFKAEAGFVAATFKAEANFNTATFSAVVYFRYAIFGDYVKFSGDRRREVFGNQVPLVLQFARIEKPEHVSFHTLSLRPHWFVNVDARKFDFTNVDWDLRNTKGEIDSLKSKYVSSPHRMLAIACRQLAVNAEENNRYEEASGFRYMAMDARRVLWVERLRGNFFKAQWKASKKILTLVNRSRKRDRKARRGTRSRLRRFVRTYRKSFDLLHWLYWAASGYGEKITRAFVLLIVIWMFFAGLYMLTGHIRVQRAADVLGAVNYSLSVMALQKPEPKSVAGLTPLLVTFETILGPVQAALLALAIRRKFMR